MKRDLYKETSKHEKTSIKRHTYMERDLYIET